MQVKWSEAIVVLVMVRSGKCGKKFSILLNGGFEGGIKKSSKTINKILWWWNLTRERLAWVSKWAGKGPGRFFDDMNDDHKKTIWSSSRDNVRIVIWKWWWYLTHERLARLVNGLKRGLGGFFDDMNNDHQETMWGSSYENDDDTWHVKDWLG